MSNIVYCNECGTQNPVGSKFCSQCGTKISAVANNPQEQVAVETPIAVEPKPLEIVTPKIVSAIACPECHKDDMIQKVTSIVQDGTYTTKGTSTTDEYSSISGQERAYSSKGDYVGRIPNGK